LSCLADGLPCLQICEQKLLTGIARLQEKNRNYKTRQ